MYRLPDLEKELQRYLNKFEAEDQEKQKQVESGELSVHDYKAWKIQIIQSRECKKIIGKIAKEMGRVNQSSIKYINSQMRDICKDAYVSSLKDIKGEINGL